MDNEMGDHSNQGKRPSGHETPEQKRARLDKNNERLRQRIAKETPEQKRQRLDRNNERQRAFRRNETENAHKARLDEQNKRQQILRENETAEANRQRLDEQNERQQIQRENETAEANRQRLAEQNERQRILRENETTEANRQRLDGQNDRQQILRENETAEANRRRLDGQNERQQILRENETAEANRQRLDGQNERQQILRENETAEANRQRLDNECRRRQAAPRRSKPEIFKENALKAITDEETINEDYLGKMDRICKHCLSLNFEGEKTGANDEFTRCCQKGQVKLEPLQKYPAFLKQLLTNQLPESSNFMTCIRSYNSSFAFASTGANIRAPPGSGPYCFRVCGQIVHRAGTIHPENGENRKFSQIYILDPDDAAFQRMELPENKECTKILMKKIGEIMQDNPWAQSIKMLHEVEKEAIAHAEANGIQPTKVMLAILQDTKSDPRRYNAPIVNEVAVVFQNEDGEPPFERDIIIHMRTDKDKPNLKFKRINILNQNLDALTYPLLFPRGEKGWHTDISRQKRNEDHSRVRVSMREYFSYRLSVRNEFSQLFSGGKLLQQYVTDCYTRAEANDLKFIKDNQAKLRAEKYSGLMDHVNNAEADGSNKVGKAVILPSSFQGSPRNMHQHYQDAMAIFTKFGKPSFFVTVTCNPKWTEILENLEPWQKVEHRPDLVARVFNLKLKHILEDICGKDKYLFGKVVAKIHVIEFQKRGLPHAHILIIVDKDERPSTADEIDRLVKAEIPDPIESPRLYEIVTKNMIHNPCTDNPQSPCRKGSDKCSKKYPKAFQENTDCDVDGYPRYKRRNFGTTLIGSKSIDNSWVVPYNPYLSLKYNCHINVEVCASIKSVKYLFKYVYKGHDCADVCITEKSTTDPKDETKEYVDSRYVSAPEAIWRIFCMRMHDQSHTIYRLPVHLEDNQVVCFQEGNEAAAIDRAAIRNTKLTAWFKLNSTDSDARKYRYWEIPIHYVWDDKHTLWKTRQKGGDKVIGRMYSVSFKDQERYYLRMLLSHEKGALSFEDLKTVNRNVYSSFYEAAKAKGYVLDDTIWQETIDEAKIFQMPFQLRQLFAYICALGCPSDASKLWNENKTDMIEDICYRLHQSEGQCRNCESYALKEIRDTLIVLNKVYSEYRLPEIPNSLATLESVAYNCTIEAQKGNDMIGSLNTEQSAAFVKIIESVNNNNWQPKCYFLDGPGGSGKTYLYTTLLHYFRGRNEIALPAASTGIAANLLEGGRTYHSLYKIPIPILDTSVSNMKSDSREAEIIRQAKLLIIDECTMASSHALNTIDRLLKEIMNMDNETGIPFGGKVILLGGDFRQCLTIVPHAMRPAIVQASLKYCNAWKDGHFKKLSLVSNMRSEDPVYSEWLLKLGNGTLENNHGLGEDVIEIPQEFICKNSLINEIFGDSLTVEDVISISKRAILCPKNDDVDNINEQVIELLSGESHTYLSDDEVVTHDEDERMNFPIEFLNTIKLSGWPSHKLTLKVGTIVMLLRNLNTRKGLCNGTRLVIRDLKNNVIKADVLIESGIGQSVLIPRIDLCSSETDLPFQMRRRQFPIKPAFAMTINKSQGQTLQKVGIQLSEPVFGHGQLYVAFSRVRRACDVKINILETSEQGKLVEGCDSTFTKNVVYKEIF